MAQIAKVVSLTGKAYVVGADGQLRALKVGDQIQKGEIIRTAQDARVELMMADGQTVAVAPEANVRVDDAMVQADNRPAAQEAAVQTATADTVIQALNRGGDLNQVIEPAAAGTDGGGESGGDATFVRLLRIVEPLDPLAYNYTLSPLPTVQVETTAVLPSTELPVLSVGASSQELTTGTGGYVTVTPDMVKASVSGMQIIEGTGGGSKVVNFLFTLDRISAYDVTVTYIVRPGSATSGVDITDNTIGTPVTVTIPAGANGFVVPVSISKDDSTEGNETFSIELLSATGAKLGNTTAEVSIIDDDIALTPSAKQVDETGGLDSVTGDLNVDYKGSGTTPVVSLAATNATWDTNTNTLTDNNGNWKAVLNGDGTYTFTQLQVMSHTNKADANDAIEINITATAQTSVVVNGETTTSTASGVILIKVLDDGPTVSIGTITESGILLNTQDADTISTATDTTGAVGFAAAFAAAVTGSFGADGEGSDSWTYALNVTGTPIASGSPNAGLVDSGLTSDGHAVYLYKLANGTVVGSTATTAPTLVTDSSVVFALTVNASGEVTLTQAQEIDHATPGASSNYADQEAILGSNLIGLTGTVLRTDGDGDTATANATVDLGGNVRFDDTGPSVSIGTITESGILLNTQDADTISTATDTTGAVGFAAAFAAAVTGSFGADGEGSDSWTYALNVTGTPIASGSPNAGLVDSGLTSDGHAVYLYKLANGTVVGSTATTAPTLVTDSSVVFALTVNASGEVTLTQAQEIDHATPGASSNYADQEAILGSNLIGLTGTVLRTDGDGDTATANATVDLGGNVRFDDTGPSVSIGTITESGILLNTQDADTISTATDTTGAVGFAAAFAAAVTGSFGADGEGSDSWTYALNVTGTPIASGSPNAGLVDSGLTSDGHAVYLYKLANGTVVGSTATTAPTLVTDSSVVFALTVNASGEVTLTQAQEIDHATPGASSNYADQEAILGSNLIGLTGTVLRTDGDGDTATANATVDLGGNVRFDDTGPSVSIGTITESGILLNTQDADTISTATDTTGAVGFAAAFAAAVTGSFGADGEGSDSWTYALNVTGTPIASGSPNAGLVDSGLTSDGHAVYLYKLANGTVVGSTATTAPTLVTDSSVVFALTVNASGEVTLTQAQEIDHATPGASSNYADQEAILGSNLIGLTGTVLRTDGDGDTATANATVDLGGNVRFDDTGPSVSIGTITESGILLNTQDADTISTATDTTGAVGFAAAFAAAVTGSFGADGEGSDSWTYALNVTGTPIASGSPNAGLVDSGLTSDGHAVYLYKLANGTVVGSTATTAPTLVTDSSVVFALTVNASGEVTLTQAQEIDHATPGASSNYADQEAILGSNLIGLTGTVLRTDGDGDTATANATVDLGGNVRFDDTGPSVSIGTITESGILLNTQDADTISTATDTTGAVGFAAAFAAAVTGSFGADGEGSDSWTYALNVTGTPIASGSPNAGLVDSGLTSDGHAVYLYKLANGTVVGSTATTAPTLVTDSSVVFALTVNASGEVTLTQAQEIDHATPGASSNYADQEAILGSNLIGLTGTVLRTDGDGDTATANATVDLGGNVRFDDTGPSISANNATSMAFYHGSAATGSVAQGSYTFVEGADSGLPADRFDLVCNNLDGYHLVKTSALSWTAVNNDPLGNSLFKVTLNGVNQYEFEMLDRIGPLVSSSSNLMQGITGGSGLPFYEFSADKFDGVFKLRLDGLTKDRSGVYQDSTINISSTELGVAGNSVQPNAEKLVIEVIPVDQVTYPNASIAKIYLSLANTGGIKVGDAFNYEVFYTTGSSVVYHETVPGELSNATNPGVVIFNDFDATRVVSRIEIWTASGGTTWKVDGLSVDYYKDISASDTTFSFTLTGQDGDGDTASANFSVDVGVGTSGDDILRGGIDNESFSAGAGNDTVYAGAGDDVIQGGAGNDTLFGNTGADVFKWTLGDVGIVGTPATDTIKDFQTGTGGDVLDLRDLLDLNGGTAGNGWTGTDANLALALKGFVQIEETASGLKLTLDTNGLSTTDVALSNQGKAQTIVLEGVHASTFNITGSGSFSLTDSQVQSVLQKMLTDGNLKHD